MEVKTEFNNTHHKGLLSINSLKRAIRGAHYTDQTIENVSTYTTVKCV